MEVGWRVGKSGKTYTMFLVAHHLHAWHLNKSSLFGLSLRCGLKKLHAVVKSCATARGLHL